MKHTTPLNMNNELLEIVVSEQIARIEQRDPQKKQMERTAAKVAANKQLAAIQIEVDGYDDNEHPDAATMAEHLA